MRLLPALARDERGTSLIEFGFLAPFLALLTMGVIDLSRGLAERFALQQAVNMGLELVQAKPAVADAKTNDVNYDFVKDEVVAQTGVAPAQVTLDRWLECDGGDPKLITETCTGTEDVARYLRVRVTKNFTGEFYYKTIPMAASGTVRIQ